MPPFGRRMGCEGISSSQSFFSKLVVTPQAAELPGHGGGEGGSGSWPGARLPWGLFICTAFSSEGPSLSTRCEVLSPHVRPPLPGRGAGGAGRWSQCQV